MSRMKFMNTEIDNLTMQETLQAIDQLIQKNESAYVVTPNVDHIVQLETNKELQAVYENASLILTDGKPLLWIAKWYGTPIKEKISGSDLFPLLCDMAAQKGYRMFFLGAAEGVAAKAAENLATRFKGLQIVGTYSPPIIIFVFLLLTRFFSHFHFFIEITSKSMSFPLAINHGYTDV